MSTIKQVDVDALAKKVADAINMASWNHHMDQVNAKQHTIALANVARDAILRLA